MSDIAVRCALCGDVTMLSQQDLEAMDEGRSPCPICEMTMPKLPLDLEVTVRLNWIEVLALYTSSAATVATLESQYSDDQMRFFGNIYKQLAAVCPENGMMVHSGAIQAVVMGLMGGLIAKLGPQSPIAVDPNLPLA